MFGRERVRLTPATSGATNARIASHFRRLQIARTVSTGDWLRVSSAMRLRHQDDVAVAEVEVLLLAVQSLVVVERNSLHPFTVRLEDDNFRSGCEWREPARECQRVEHGGPASELEAAGAGDFADERNLEAIDVRDDDRDFGVRHVGAQFLRQHIAK